MAQILPEDWHGHEGINEGERHTLGWLDANLGDDITVFAGIRWACKLHGRSQTHFGQVDFVVMGPAGDLLLIEQKNGALVLDDDGRLVKQYKDGKSSDPVAQIRRSADAFKQQWQQQRHEGHLAVDYAVLLPNHRVLEYSAVSTEADQIYGRDQMQDLIQRIRNGMGQSAANPSQARNVRRFIMGSIGLEG